MSFDVYDGYNIYFTVVGFFLCRFEVLQALRRGFRHKNRCEFERLLDVMIEAELILLSFFLCGVILQLLSDLVGYVAAFFA